MRYIDKFNVRVQKAEHIGTSFKQNLPNMKDFDSVFRFESSRLPSVGTVARRNTTVKFIKDGEKWRSSYFVTWARRSGPHTLSSPLSFCFPLFSFSLGSFFFSRKNQKTKKCFHDAVLKFSSVGIYAFSSCGRP